MRVTILTLPLALALTVSPEGLAFFEVAVAVHEGRRNVVAFRRRTR